MTTSQPEVTISVNVTVTVVTVRVNGRAYRFTSSRTGQALKAAAELLDSMGL